MKNDERNEETENKELQEFLKQYEHDKKEAAGKILPFNRPDYIEIYAGLFLGKHV